MKKHTYWVLLGIIIMASFIGCKEVTPEQQLTDAEKQQRVVTETIMQMEEISLKAENTLIDAIGGIPAARGLLRSSTLGTLGMTRAAAGEETLTSEEEDLIWESLTEEEQHQILSSAEVYAEEFQSIVPPTVFYKGVPEGVIETADEVIVGIDMVFSKITPEGLQGAYALASAYYEEGSLATRGVSSWAIPKWRSGKVDGKKYNAVVTYTFEGVSNSGGKIKIISSADKQLVRNAMALWENGTGSLKFQEDTKWSKWDSFKYGMGWYKVVKIYKDSRLLNTGTSVVGGKTMPGRMPWSFMALNTGVFEEENEWLFSNTIVHELGHVLGLMHEFDRRDADDHITWDSKEDKKMRAPWIARISYYKIGSFDIYSTMHYDQGYMSKKTNTVMPCPEIPSSGDFASVKKIYNM